MLSDQSITHDRKGKWCCPRREDPLARRCSSRSRFDPARSRCWLALSLTDGRPAPPCLLVGRRLCAETGTLRRGWREGELRTLAGDSARAERSAGQHAHPSGRSASSSHGFPREVNGFLTRFAILCGRKGKLGEPPMATPQVKTVRKTAPAARSNPIRRTAGKPKIAYCVVPGGSKCGILPP